MTCKDCIHAEKCRDYLAYKLDKALDGINGSEKPICEFFKDKSKFIELKAKIGDKVYCFDYGETRVIENTIRGIRPYIGHRTIYSTEYHTFDDNAFDKTVFFTKEQAEQALKERENDT